MAEPTPERRRKLLRALTQEAVDAGTYGEPAPERTPPDDTTGEEFAAYADEASEWADLTLPTALEGWPDDTTEGEETPWTT